MARGEVLSNPEMLLQADRVLTMLGQVALEHDNDLSVKFNVSTIMPRSLDRSLTKVFRFVQPTIYYSLYSANEDFRRHWMPNAMPLQRAIDLLLEWQLHSKKRIKIHHCFIQGQNDSEDDICRWADVLNSREMDWDFNLVRYNPYSTEQGQESSDEVIDERMQLIRSLCPGSVKIIPRVGFDVKASCGMFVEKKYGV
jgi:adenine C2-methylase RlmN of 23S rRNA A2503 and tRNA A37